MAAKRKPRRVTKRKPRKVRKVTKPKRHPVPATVFDEDWEVIVCTDLHVSAKTIDLVLTTLSRIRELSDETGIKQVVCLGDFWDARNILSVRHLHVLMDEFMKWKFQGIKLMMIPGNHDQVTVDGRIHGVRVFEPFDNITVATRPLHDHGSKVAILPWREDPEEQAQIFADVPRGYTVFAHAEAPGSLANSGKRMEGRFSKAELTRLRAVYLGHFHKRQQIGKNCWYIGNPYEKDFAEMGDPKGIAIIRAGSIEPEWHDFDDMPKHWRLNFPADVKQFSKPGENDVVEVYASGEAMLTAAYETAVSKLAAADVRKLPLPDPKKSVVPVFALGLEEAIDEYAGSPETWGAHFSKAEVEMLREIGREILAEVPDAGVIVPLAKSVTPISVTVTNFCAIKGSVHLDLRKQGAVLLSGEMGVGKTSLCDAITWALYDKTSPRKAGSSTSTLKADRVVHDDADRCKVDVKLLLDDKHEVTISREKSRGKGSRVNFELPVEITMPSGISDQQQLVHKIIGVDYELWRTCVYLGQGSVGNFITDADKKRKELLSRAFQLGACRSAQKLVRGWLKELRNEQAPIEKRLHGNRARAETLEQSDFSAEMKQWEERRTYTIKQAEQAIEDAKAKVAQFDEKLATQGQWEESEKQHTQHVATLEKQLTDTAVPERAGHLHSSIGAAKAEKGLAERDLAQLKKSYQASQRGSTCPTCGQAIPMETHEQQIQEMEVQIQSKQQEIQSLDHRIANDQSKLGQLMAEGGADTEAIRTQLQEARTNLSKVRQGLDTLKKIRAQRDSLAKQWEQARETIVKQREMTNPFQARQEQKESQLAAMQADIQKDEAELKELMKKSAVFEYWDDGFGPKGVPVLVLRTVLHELETHANRFLARLTQGRVFAQMEMLGDDLKVRWFKFETPTSKPRERSYTQLSGGERRCAEMAFSPFALSEMIFSRTGVRIPMLVIDELTTHLSPKAKPQVCSILNDLGRDTVVVIDHDPSVQGAFDVVYEVEKQTDGSASTRRI